MFAFSQFRVYSLYCECTTFVRATTALSYYCYFTGYNFRSKRWRILNLIFERGVFFLSRDGEEPVSDFRQYYFEMILYIFFCVPRSRAHSRYFLLKSESSGADDQVRVFHFYLFFTFYQYIVAYRVSAHTERSTQQDKLNAMASFHIFLEGGRGKISKRPVNNWEFFWER